MKVDKSILLLIICVLTSVQINAAPGDLDSTFGINGEVITDVPAAGDYIRRIALQADGKILVLATTAIASPTFPIPFRFRIFRLMQNGSVDNSFGAGGSIIGISMHDFTVMPDDRIIVVYYLNNSAEVRGYTKNGQPDTSFGTNGTTVFTSPSGLADGRRIQNGPNGTIVVLAAAKDSQTLIARMNSNGMPDDTFGVNGVAYGWGIDFAYLGTNSRLITDGFSSDVLIQPDGKIVYGLNGDWSHSYWLARQNADGTIDTSFGNQGRATVVVDTSYPYHDALSFGLAFDANGKIISSGATVSWNYMHTSTTAITRLNTNGSLDQTFGTNGQTKFTSAIQDFRGPASAICIMPSGNILLGGMASQNFAITRLKKNGSIDASFGTNGTIMTPIGFVPGYSSIHAATLQPDNKIVVAGAVDVRGPAVAGLVRYIQIDSPSVSSTFFDYDGDQKSDVSVFRPSSGAWYLQQSQAGFFGVQFGVDSDKITPADFDGDGKTDIAVYRPATGIWYVLNSSNDTVTYYQFGLAEDLPTPADYDGDGKADISVFRPSQGTWYRTNSSDNSFYAQQFGISEDRPTIGDFDSDGKADVAVFRPSSGVWYRTNSLDNSFYAEQFGIGSDVLVPADYDGDGNADLAVFRRTTGIWYIKNSSNANITYTNFGLAEDIPSPGDFDGDGRADVCVFRPSDGTWYRNNSLNGQFVAFQFGTNGDKPTMAAFRY